MVTTEPLNVRSGPHNSYPTYGVVPAGTPLNVVGISEDHGVQGPAIGDLYPDHRGTFLQTFNLMLHYAKAEERELQVDAPLLDLSKAEVIQLGRQLKVPLDRTWTCYSGGDRPCGHCRACATRGAAFLQTGHPDPLLSEAVRA